MLETAAHSGTKPGCGDCIWTVIADCPYNVPGKADDSTLCVGATHTRGCRTGVLERLYLTDAVLALGDEGTLCIRPGHHIIPVGDLAAAAVQNYLKDVRPPDLTITTRPHRETLAGLPTYFTARTPKRLRPTPFGNGQITETITIAPIRTDWAWGDGSDSGWTAAASTLTHAYVHGGIPRGSLTTRWGATYTITFQGRTFGPYDATGTLTRRQTFTLPVDTSSPVLVSH